MVAFTREPVDDTTKKKARFDALLAKGDVNLQIIKAPLPDPDNSSSHVDRLTQGTEPRTLDMRLTILVKCGLADTMALRDGVREEMGLKLKPAEDMNVTEDHRRGKAIFVIDKPDAIAKAIAYCQKTQPPHPIKTFISPFLCDRVTSNYAGDYDRGVLSEECIRGLNHRDYGFLDSGLAPLLQPDPQHHREDDKILAENVKALSYFLEHRYNRQAAYSPVNS